MNPEETAIARLGQRLETDFRMLESRPGDLADFRACRQNILAELTRGFGEGAEIDTLVHGYAQFVDRLLSILWRRFGCAEEAGCALVAVGGYGRAELHPGSDIDILILVPPDREGSIEEPLSRFITFLWDIGLEVGHSVRTIRQCVEEAENDVSIATTLFEARRLTGSSRLFRELQQAVSPDVIWDSARYFRAKLAEQERRKQRFGEAAYRLEPNVKEGPGGLRDIQMVSWISQRHFAAGSLQDLIAKGFLREGEYRELIEGQRFLWRVRFALHMLTGRREDRLLFNLQRALADTFGFSDQLGNLGVEQFMQCYFRTIGDLQRLSELLLQSFKEEIEHPETPHGEVHRIHPRFQVRGGDLEPIHDQVFLRYPPALLEVFHLLQTHPEVRGIRAHAMRLIRSHRHLVDAPFRRNPVCRSLFMSILRGPQGVTHELRRMNRFGILGAYLPAFGRIVGRMQFDLFHVYTVDEHTLHVVRNARRLGVPEAEHELPLASRIYATIRSPVLLVLGALFHDIGKGRGGDHSELGALDAMHFCQHHGMSDEEAAMVSWLVRSHLLMSLTAQRRDISDPEVVLDFARAVRTQERLDLLYLLTIADIRGTNPELWNGWKDSLLKTLYHATVKVLERGLEIPPDIDEQIGQTCSEAMGILVRRGVDEERVEEIWSEFEVEYFVRHTPDEIAWHTHALAHTRSQDLPLVLVRHDSSRGTTEIFVYTDDHARLFAKIATTLTQLGLDIVDARIITTHGAHTLDSFIVLEGMGHATDPSFRVEEIRAALRERLLQQGNGLQNVTRRTPRRLQNFTVATELEFSEGSPSNATRLWVRALDRPGLLSTIGCIFAEEGVSVRTARIATAGERVEDQFLLFNARNQALSLDEKQKLRERLMLEI
jgi:[protein-PII] uridylyltransferase